MHRTAILSLARYLPRVQRRDPCRIVRRRCRPAAHHSRFTELPRSGRSVWRPEVDRASWEYRSSSSWAKRYVTRFRQRRGNGEGRKEYSLVDMIERRGTIEKKGNRYMLRSVPKTVSTERTNPSQICPTSAAHSQRSHHRCRSNEGRRWYEKSAERKKRWLRASYTGSRGLLQRIERETKKKRVGHRGEWAKKRTQRWITRAECLSISSSVEFVRGEEISRRSERERDDYSGRPSKTSKSIYEAHYDFRVSRGRVPN